MTRVLAQAVVDLSDAPIIGGKPVFLVTVRGLPPHGQSRFYTIREKSDTLAAQEGIRRFVEEMERLYLKD